jgi:hypothetical protein
MRKKGKVLFSNKKFYKVIGYLLSSLLAKIYQECQSNQHQICTRNKIVHSEAKKDLDH